MTNFVQYGIMWNVSEEFFVKVALTGSTGHMGIQTLKEFLKIKEIDTIKVLLRDGSKKNKMIKRLAKKFEGKIEIIYGNIANIEDVRALVLGTSYLFNLAALIPPSSDKKPNLSFLTNEIGTKNVAKVCEENPDIKLVEITSVALYGSRNIKHPFTRIGDPLLPSVFDVYAVHKLRGEFCILESNIKNYVIIRQTAMIYLKMLNANMSDGLMFHTPFNVPLEWVSAEDSGKLMANIIKADLKGKLNKDNFWNKIFNLGGGEQNRLSGFETLEGGFKIVGGETYSFFAPNYNALRNFHGGFFYDGDKLEKLFHYQHDNIDDYWEKILKKYPYYSFGKVVPQKIIRKFAIERLFKDSNSPAYWYKHNDIPRLTAFFGSKEQYEQLPKDWAEFHKDDLRKVRSIKHYKPLDYGFDIEKSDKDITLKDLKNVAKMHGGKLLEKEFKTGDIYKTLKWQDQDGNVFEAKPHTILRGGHWFNPLYNSYTWDFDRLAKKDKIFAQIWYDSHEENEKNTYCMDDKYEVFLKWKQP